MVLFCFKINIIIIMDFISTSRDRKKTGKESLPLQIPGSRISIFIFVAMPQGKKRAIEDHKNTGQNKKLKGKCIGLYPTTHFI